MVVSYVLSVLFMSIGAAGSESVAPIRVDASRIEPFSDGLAPVYKYSRKEGGGSVLKAGFVDKTGKLVIPYEYDSVWPFSDGCARVEKNSKYGFISKRGRVVVPIKCENALCFSEGLLV